MFSHERIEEMKKYIKEYSRINIDDYQQILQTLKTYSIVANAYKVSEDIFSPKFLHYMHALMKQDLFPDELLTEWYNLDMLNKKIQPSIIIDVPELLEYMKNIEEIGLMSAILFSGIQTWANGIELMTKSLGDVSKSMDEFAEKVNTIIEKICSIQVGRGAIQVCKGTIETKMSDKKVKNKNCQLEHNVPLCPNCGWRNSWLKAFRKRGVYVVEAVSNAKESIWYNNVNSC